MVLLHKSAQGQTTPDPRRGYATATACGQPSSVNQLKNSGSDMKLFDLPLERT